MKQKQISGLEHRTFPVTELRAESTDSGVMVRGYAVVFDEIATIGDYFREVVKPGSMTKTLHENSSIMALWNHDRNFVLGNTHSGTLNLEQDSRGLRFDLKWPESSQYDGFQKSVVRGDVTGMSFGFAPVKEAWQMEKGELDLRELLEIRLYEISLTAFPAYEGTSAYADEGRDIWNARKEALERTTPEPGPAPHLVAGQAEREQISNRIRIAELEAWRFQKGLK